MGQNLSSPSELCFTQTVANRIIEITPDGIIDRLCTYDEYMHIAEAQDANS